MFIWSGQHSFHFMKRMKIYWKNSKLAISSCSDNCKSAQKSDQALQRKPTYRTQNLASPASLADEIPHWAHPLGQCTWWGKAFYEVQWKCLRSFPWLRRFKVSESLCQVTFVIFLDASFSSIPYSIYSEDAKKLRIFQNKSCKPPSKPRVQKQSHLLRNKPRAKDTIFYDTGAFRNCSSRRDQS